MQIKTEYQGWWIDSRGKLHHEWIAFDDDSYDGPGSPLGSGETEEEAIEWLHEQLDERLREYNERVRWHQQNPQPETEP
jgi:hypothetical protein